LSEKILKFTKLIWGKFKDKTNSSPEAAITAKDTGKIRRKVSTIRNVTREKY
jgi:hypothetical protein